MPREVPINTIEPSLSSRRLIESAGVYPKDIHDPVILDAYILHTCLTRLMDEFSAGQGDVTGSGLDEASKPPTVFTCGTLSAKSIDEFLAYLQEKQRAIPGDLRAKMDAVFGYNYGTEGGIRITKSQIQRITHDELQQVIRSASTSIHRPLPPEQTERLVETIGKEISKIVTPN